MEFLMQATHTETKEEFKIFKISTGLIACPKDKEQPKSAESFNIITDAISSGIYKHYKGNNYSVVGEVYHSETKERMILYISQNNEKNIWVRPKSQFVSKVFYEGQNIKRFQFINNLKNIFSKK